MMPSKANIKAEQDCMNSICTALEKLSKHHYKDDNDSVAEGDARRAVVRVLQWAVSFHIPLGIIVKASDGGR